MDESKKRDLEVLQNKSEDLLRRIKAAVKLELDYWNEKSDPPNLTEIEFKMVLSNVPGNYESWYEPRKSDKGKYGHTGEKSVFYLKFSIPLGRFIIHYLVKGFFFEEGNLHGVCIQTFRQTGRSNRGKLRLV